MNEGVIASADYKVSANGRKYPAKRIHMGTKEQQVSEASYRGNIGVMELAKFHSTAKPADKEKFTELMKKKASAKSDEEQRQMASQIWDHVQKVTGTKLHQMESTMIPFKTMLESKEDFILQSLADKDINASIKDGKVVVHDHTQHAKAKSMVKRMGMPHEVVKELKGDQHKLDVNKNGKIDAHDLHLLRKKQDVKESTDSDTVVQEAMPTHEFNKLVRGYLAHKKAAKAGGFKPMSMDQYKRASVKALATAPIKEETLDELSKETLSSYQQKASGDTNPKKAQQRMFGVLRSAMKLAKKKEPLKESDKIDTVEMDIPLLTRVLEMAREDIKSDEDLHEVVTKLIEMAKNGTLTMDNYKKLTEDKKMIVPTLKPRDPNHTILAAKKNAGGAHRDKKKEMKRGNDKHKSRMYEETQSDSE